MMEFLEDYSMSADAAFKLFLIIFLAIRNKIPIFTKTKTICAMKLGLCTTAIGVALVLSLNAFGDSRTTPPL